MNDRLRNVRMAIAVLSGQPAVHVAKEFSVSAVRVGQIVRRTCALIRQPDELPDDHQWWTLRGLLLQREYYLRRLWPLVPKDKP